MNIPKQETKDAIVVDTVEPSYSVRVKAEYILSHPITTITISGADTNPAAEEAAVEAETVVLGKEKSSSNQNHNNNNNKCNKGNAKRRPRDAKIDSSFKLCHAIVQGRECSYGDTCKYSHDMKEMLAIRLPDINPEIPIPQCPIYQSKGYCPFGIQCRVGSQSHVNGATGQNFIVSSSTSTEANRVTVLNIISKDTQSLLRKKQYPFTYVRKSLAKNHNSNNGNTEKMSIHSDNVNHVDNVNDLSKQNDFNNNKNQQTVEELIENSNNYNHTDASTTNATTSLQVEFLPNTVDETSKTTTAAVTEAAEVAMVTGCSTHSSDVTKPVETKMRKIIDFRNKVYVAPLTTVGNLPFRRVMKKFGADITCGEMALCMNLLQGQASEWALIKRHADEDVFGIQLAAGYADLFIHTAELIEKENIQVDFVDMNLGCPLDLICDKGAGAKLMQRESVLRDTLVGMTQTLSCPVTIKMRTGWDDKNPFAHKLVQKIHSWGISGIGAIMVRV